ncbi:MAG: ABC transporter substrate-binding protein, partial [Candidatus Limnocylindrales bacterium]
MEERIVRRSRVAGSLVAVMLMAVACSSGSSSASPAASTPASAPAASGSAGESPAASAGALGGSVSVIGTWTGAEQESFMAMVKPWEDQTGAKVEYTGTRDINNILTTGIQSGLLPDLAGLPGPGQMAEYVQAGALKPLNDVIDMTAYTADTAPGLVTLGTVNDQLYGIFIKADIKGLFWYNTGVYKDGAPATYDELLAKGKTTADGIGGEAKTFCVGLESGAASGWPGSDWVEQFVLNGSGPDVYDKWVAGQQKWTSPEIKA